MPGIPRPYQKDNSNQHPTMVGASTNSSGVARMPFYRAAPPTPPQGRKPSESPHVGSLPLVQASPHINSPDSSINSIIRLSGGGG